MFRTILIELLPGEIDADVRPNVVVVTAIGSTALFAAASWKVREQDPVLRAVTFTVSAGPLPDNGDAVAMPLHVVFSVNVPVYPVSVTLTGSVPFDPMVKSDRDAGESAIFEASGRIAADPSVDGGTCGAATF